MDILINQVDQAFEMFKEHEDSPPISKNQPPVAGAIMWERSLFHRIKRTVLKFQTMDEMLNTEIGKQVWTNQMLFQFFLLISDILVV